jgi:SAM-dependent methyltransferase
MTHQMASSTGGSAYYQHSGPVPLASCISMHVRRKMFDLFMREFTPGPETSVLDIGVTSDTTFQESNYFEKLYPYPHRVTCVGTEDGSHLLVEYPGLIYRRVQPGAALPFSDGEFDIVFSNAVIEHAGSRREQAAFAHEACRVGKAFFITTPSRLFPIEHHTGLPLLHYLPPPLFRAALRHTRYRYWADEQNLNILTARAFTRLFPEEVMPIVRTVSLAGIPSNLVAFGRSNKELYRS